jgi:hypothetical protein
MTCPQCSRKRRCPWALIDRDGVEAARYCSRRCAQDDAWGPRFRTYMVEKRP